MRPAWLRRGWAAATVAVLATAGCASVPKQTEAERRGLAEAVVARWPAPSRQLALRFMDEYGLPDRIDLDRLLWRNRGEWRSTAVWHRAPRYQGCLGEEVLEQTVDYRVPAHKAAALAWLGGQVRVLRGGRGLSSCAPDEELNRLALNLADEILRGVRDPHGVRAFYERIVEMRAAGRASPYMERLLFLPAEVQPAP